MMDCASFLKSFTKSSDFGCGFVVIGYLPQIFNIFGLILIFLLWFKVLEFSFRGRGFIQLLYGIRGKSNHIRNGLCSKIGFGEERGPNILSCNCGPLKFLENSKPANLENLVKSKRKELFNQNIENVNEEEEEEEEEEECFEEDQVFDVIVLRKLLKIARQRAKMALMELEKERRASASATDEAMAMILRLQNEKSSIEIELNHYRRLSEHKQEYDREVIQSLQWNLRNHESERSLLEDKLRLCIKKLKQHVKEEDDELEEFKDFDINLKIFKNNPDDDDEQLYESSEW